MRVVTRPRVSESEKPVEKTKEEGEEVRCSFLPLLPWGNGKRFAYLVSHLVYIA